MGEQIRVGRLVRLPRLSVYLLSMFYSFKRQGAIPGELLTGDIDTGVSGITVIFKSVLDVRQKVRSGNLKGAYTCKAL